MIKAEITFCFQMPFSLIYFFSIKKDLQQKIIRFLLFFLLKFAFHLLVSSSLISFGSNLCFNFISTHGECQFGSLLNFQYCGGCSVLWGKTISTVENIQYGFQGKLTLQKTTGSLSMISITIGFFISSCGFSPQYLAPSTVLML